MKEDEEPTREDFVGPEAPSLVKLTEENLKKAEHASQHGAPPKGALKKAGKKGAAKPAWAVTEK
jgi:hypothetical protein